MGDTTRPYDPTAVGSYPIHQQHNQDNLASIGTLVRESVATVPNLRRIFRGEARVNHANGSYSYEQLVKPMFVRVDHKTNLPLREEYQSMDAAGKVIMKTRFVPHDEAIEEVLSMLFFMGINPITFTTNIKEDIVLDDLKEFECKLSALLCLKQKDWGIDKEGLPMTMTKLKTIVQDARYQAKDGHTIKAIQRTVQRIEQVSETNQTKSGFGLQGQGKGMYQ